MQFPYQQQLHQKREHQTLRKSLFTHIHAKMKKTVFGLAGDTPQVALQLIKPSTCSVSSQSLASLSFVKWFGKQTLIS